MVEDTEKDNKNILVVASKYHSSENNPYLTNDLVNEVSKHVKKVVVIGLGDLTCHQKKGNISENIILIPASPKYFKYLYIWPKLCYLIVKLNLKEGPFDQVIMFAPLSVIWPAALAIHFLKIKKKTAIVFDLFPIHQVQIGSLPPKISSIARSIERYLLSRFNEITAMGENNKKWIENYYKTKLSGSIVKVLPLWSVKTETKKPIKSQTDELIKFVFGGQIIKGREVDTIIEYLSTMLDKGVKLTLDIYSEGSDFELLKEKYKKENWINFNNRIPRERYFDVLSGYHIGIVVTDRRVTLPTFPSKILDYIQAGLASYCLVENETDLAGISINSDLIYLNYFDFTDEELERSIAFIQNLKTLDDVCNELDCLKEYFSVTNAALRLLE